MPLIMIASCGLRPMMIGKTNVAPNIATTCCAPRPTVAAQDSRSSGRDRLAGRRGLAVVDDLPAKSHVGSPLRTGLTTGAPVTRGSRRVGLSLLAEGAPTKHLGPKRGDFVGPSCVPPR